ncbi:MAG: DNA polymerase III subunit gamma/tau [Desulfomonile tiedjei]|nr:DNA polymerase III subunit gamma/tau [Desulfomonile tiedjei]
MPSYLVLARKYRPSTFSDVVGQDHVVKTLQNSILSGRVAHAFLFCGVRGVGKTTVARILAKALNCSGRQEGQTDPCNECSSCKEIGSGISVDVQEIDGASHTSVENIREINENIKYPPVSSPYKIIIIDEVHMISINAFNALLKTLEEPPAHAKFIFATTEAHKVPPTINSRCQRFNFKTITMRDIISGMSGILAQEGIEADEEALALIAREAQGSFRDALSLLDQVIAFGAERITSDDVVGILGIAGRNCFGRLMGSILDRDRASALGLIHEIFQEGYDPEQFVLDMIQYLRNLIMVAAVPKSARPDGMVDAPPSEVEEMEALASKTSGEELQNLFSIVLRSEAEVKRSGNPSVAVEMLALKMAYAPSLKDLSEIIHIIDSSATAGTGAARPEARSAIEPPARVKSKGPASDKAAVPNKPETKRFEPEEDVQEPPTDSFTITRVVPVPAGNPDEVWASLKDRLSESGADGFLRAIMDHGNLISFGPTEVEIGFHKAFYKEEFESKLKTKPQVMEIFEEFFGDAKLKILTLAQETSLDTQKPYSVQADGQTDLDRALRHEAIENPITKAVLAEFEDSSIEEINILSSKP